MKKLLSNLPFLLVALILCIFGLYSTFDGNWFKLMIGFIIGWFIGQYIIKRLNL